MTQEQIAEKETREAKAAELIAAQDMSASAFVDFNQAQLDVLSAFELYDERNEIVANAANQALKNILKGKMAQADRGTMEAKRKGRKAVEAACIAEYEKASAAWNTL